MGKKCKVKLDVGTVYQKEEGGTYYFRYQVQHERKCVIRKTGKSCKSSLTKPNMEGIISGIEGCNRQHR